MPDEKSTESPPQALQGMRVLELTHAWAGPLCGMMLADMGAEVIKIEQPDQDGESRGGAPYVSGESVIFMMTNRNKKSVALNLKEPDDHRAFLELVRNADVLVQNMRPGALERLGLGYEDLKVVNPGLIYTSVSGFGRVGPDADVAGVDQIIVALIGLAATTMDNTDSLPRTIGAPVCDIMAAMWACQGTLCAYVWRQKTGVGQRVDASLLEAGLSVLINPIAKHFYTPGYTGLKTPFNGASEFLLTADKKYISLFASYPPLWDRLSKALQSKSISENPRFKTRESRTANAKELATVLAKIFEDKSSHDWLELLREAGVPAARVNTIGEALQDKQVKASRMLQMQEHPRAGSIPLLDVPVKLSATPGRIRSPSPALGEHTTEVLNKLRSLRKG